MSSYFECCFFLLFFICLNIESRHFTNGKIIFAIFPQRQSNLFAIVGFVQIGRIFLFGIILLGIIIIVIVVVVFVLINKFIFVLLFFCFCIFLLCVKVIFRDKQIQATFVVRSHITQIVILYLLIILLALSFHITDSENLVSPLRIRTSR